MHMPGMQYNIDDGGGGARAPRRRPATP
eukprot:SAG31_NODE_2963_length_4844_cov_7.134457_5_plen_27_part_01